MADDPPRTHTWRRSSAPEPAPEPPLGRIAVPVPPGDPMPSAELARRIRDSLAGWPVVLLRANGVVNGRPKPGPWKGSWLRGQIGDIVDRTLGPAVAHDLLGAHAPGRVSGGAWAPIALRTSPMGEDRIANDGDVRIEIFLHGRAARVAGDLVGALLDPPRRLAEADGGVRWRTIQSLLCDDDGEPRWKSAEPGVRPDLVPLDRIREPRLRRSRVMCTLHSPAAMARRGEVGEPWPDFVVLVDRMGRTISTLLKRARHDGPLLPDADLLRAASVATLVANHTRVVQIPAHLVGAEPPRPVRGAPPPDDRVPSLIGSATFRGDVSGLQPLLTAASWVGMGPGRQNGLGEVSFR